MDLIVGTAYLCEVWEAPPEVLCNGQQAELRVMRYAGTISGDWVPTRHIRCDNGDLIELKPSFVMQSWLSIDRPMSAWRVVPLRPLVADTEDGELVGLPVVERLGPQVEPVPVLQDAGVHRSSRWTSALTRLRVVLALP